MRRTSPGWLDDEQQDSWRAFAAAMVKLRWALECQLQHDAGLSFIEYHALARLSENSGHTMRMSELAEVDQRLAVPAVAPDQAPGAAQPRPARTRPDRWPVHQRDPDPGRAAPSHRQRTRPCRQGPRAGDRRSQPGRAARATHSVRTNPPTNRNQRPIAGGRQLAPAATPSRSRIACPMSRSRPAGGPIVIEVESGQTAARLSSRPNQREEADGEGVTCARRARRQRWDGRTSAMTSPQEQFTELPRRTQEGVKNLRRQ